MLIALTNCMGGGGGGRGGRGGKGSVEKEGARVKQASHYY